MEISTPLPEHFVLGWTDYSIISSFISHASEMLADILKP